MTEKINFAIGFHLHQPVGNFEHVFEHATKVSYRPLIQTMAKHPKIPFALHISGPIWEYFESEHPDIIESIRIMVARNQCELMGGGFYEPILTVIPERDAIGQMKMMNDFLNTNFNVNPSGIWLTERIWEPHLPKLLAQVGIKYTAVDDYHLKSVGITGENLLGYFVTEHDGKPLSIFPISETLRYSMPFQPVEKTIEYLKKCADNSGERLVVFADDGEKFGLWPHTYEWVWKKGWVDSFLTALEKNSEWIEIYTFSQILEKLTPCGRVYMPTGSYFEMSEWTLPATLSYRFHRWVEELKKQGDFEQHKSFIKGGFWRNFFIKYPESNWMHKRMIRVSEVLAELAARSDIDLRDAYRALYRSQCNCAYWHGIFGGLYLPHLREGVWQNIIKAENIALKSSKMQNIVIHDVDFDGLNEIRLISSELIIWIAPHRGGNIEEISFLPRNVNVLDTLSRHREGYHRLLTESANDEHRADKHKSIHDDIVFKEDGLEGKLYYDWSVRRFAQDHFLTQEIDPSRFEQMKYRDIGDFTLGSYEPVQYIKKELYSTVILNRSGALWQREIRFPIDIIKIYELVDNKLILAYRIHNRSEMREFKFAIETNFSLLSPNSPQVTLNFHDSSNAIYRAGQRTALKNFKAYDLTDKIRGFKIKCRADSDELWMFPVETVSSSEGGLERVYQETALVHIYNFNLEKHGRKTIYIEWTFNKI